MSINIGFEWFKDRTGYRKIPPVRFKSSLMAVEGEDVRESITPEHIAPKLYDWETYRPLEDYPNLYCEFANIKTSENVLYFIQRFGPLTLKGRAPEGDDVDVIIREAGKMRKFLEDYEKGGREAIMSLVGAETAKLRGMEYNISVDPLTAHLCVQLKPDSLLTALWLQMFQSLNKLEKIRSCRFCHKWFEVGPGTGRRGDAQFCTQEHKTVYFSKKRSQKGRK